MHLTAPVEWTLASKSKSLPSVIEHIDSLRCLTENFRRGVFDFSLIASIASHLSYWSDEDISHFMISQLLSKQRVIRH